MGVKVVNFLGLWEKLVSNGLYVFSITTHLYLLMKYEFLALFLHLAVKIELDCSRLFSWMNFGISLFGAHDNFLLLLYLDHVFLYFKFLTIHDSFHVFDCRSYITKARARQVLGGFLPIKYKILKGLPIRRSFYWTDWGWLMERYFVECKWLAIGNGMTSFRMWSVASFSGNVKLY